MKISHHQDEMASDRQAIANCRAELRIAEHLAEALQHEIEVRECHLKMAEASVRGEALMYCERKVRTYRPELGTCEDEQWKVVKSWNGLSIVEVQPEAATCFCSSEREIENLKSEVEFWRKMNDTLRQENVQLKAKAKKDSLHKMPHPHKHQKHINLTANRKLQKGCEESRKVHEIIDPTKTISPSQNGIHHPESKPSNHVSSLANQNPPSAGHQIYGLDSSPPDAVTHAKAIQLSTPLLFESRYGITPARVLASTKFTKLIELANFRATVMDIEQVPVAILQERTGGTVDALRFRELFARFVDLCCADGKAMTDGDLEMDDGAFGVYLELRNAGGRAVERWQMLVEYERDFL